MATGSASLPILERPGCRRRSSCWRSIYIDADPSLIFANKIGGRTIRETRVHTGSKRVLHRALAHPPLAQHFRSGFCLGICISQPYTDDLLFRPVASHLHRTELMIPSMFLSFLVILYVLRLLRVCFFRYDVYMILFRRVHVNDRFTDHR